jgi:adenine-specific DNA-methyltransferase
MSNALSLTPNVSPGAFFTNAPEDSYIASVAESHRKKLGQFFTPVPVAEFMAEWVIGNPTCRTILDPAIGLGIFFRAILRVGRQGNYKFTGYDIDAAILEKTKLLFAANGNADIELNDKDYLFNDWGKEYDGIICNPPYFKFQDYKSRAAGLKEFQTRVGMSLSGFTNIYTMFMLKSVGQLSPGGRAAYLVPSEFLNSDYGTTVKKFLLESETLRYVILFRPDEQVFTNALTTSCILLFARDGNSKTVTFVQARKADGLQTLSAKLTAYPQSKVSGKVFSRADLDPNIKWRAYYQKQSGREFKNLVPLSTYGKVVRGIATGDNDFFTFDEKKKTALGIADKYLLPCITKAAHAKSSFFTQKDYENLRHRGSKVFLLNATDLMDRAVRRYIESGERAGVSARYLTSHRTPWYSLEHRPPAPLLVMVFNRGGLRFVRNETGVRNLTCFHSIYPNLFAAAKVDLLMAYCLTDVSKKILDDNRREYGGGLNKFEPNDLNRAAVINLDAIEPGTERRALELYSKYRASVLNSQPDSELLAELNDVFSGALAK